MSVPFTLFPVEAGVPAFHVTAEFLADGDKLAVKMHATPLLSEFIDDEELLARLMVGYGSLYSDADVYLVGVRHDLFRVLCAYRDIERDCDAGDRAFLELNIITPLAVALGIESLLAA